MVLAQRGRQKRCLRGLGGKMSLPPIACPRIAYDLHGRVGTYVHKSSDFSLPPPYYRYDPHRGTGAHEAREFLYYYTRGAETLLGTNNPGGERTFIAHAAAVIGKASPDQDYYPDLRTLLFPPKLNIYWLQHALGTVLGVCTEHYTAPIVRAADLLNAVRAAERANPRLKSGSQLYQTAWQLVAFLRPGTGPLLNAAAAPFPGTEWVPPAGFEHLSNAESRLRNDIASCAERALLAIAALYNASPPASPKPAAPATHRPPRSNIPRGANPPRRCPAIPASTGTEKPKTTQKMPPRLCWSKSSGDGAISIGAAAVKRQAAKEVARPWSHNPYYPVLAPHE